MVCQNFVVKIIVKFKIDLVIEKFKDEVLLGFMDVILFIVFEVFIVKLVNILDEIEGVFIWVIVECCC